MRNYLTKSRVFFQNGVVLEICHNYKTFRGLKNYFERVALKENTTVEKIQYRLEGQFLK